MPVVGHAPERSTEASLSDAGSDAHAWDDIVRGTIAPGFVLHRARPGPGFTGSVLLRCQVHTMLLWISADTHLLERSAEAVRRAPLGRWVVTVPLSGSSIVRQGGNRARIDADTFSVLDGDQPFRIDIEQPMQALALVVPHAELDRRNVGARLLPAVALPTAVGVGAVMRAALVALASQAGPLERGQDAAVVGHVVSLVALAASLPDPSRGRRSADRFLRAATDDVEQHLHRPELCAAETAQRLGISVSYLTKLFARRGTSYGRWVSNRRMEHAWARLAPAERDPRTVSTIATECGFADSAHFARVFRARFGITPSQRRLGAASVAAVRHGLDPVTPGYDQV